MACFRNVLTHEFFLSPTLPPIGKSKLMRMRSALDADSITAPVPPEYLDVNVTASVLKSYLRSLPEPLLTFELYHEIMNVSQINNEQQRKAAILNIINQLPARNYDNLRYLMKFLSLLSENNQRNKMSTSNIAIVMSPNLLWAKDEDKQDYAQQVSCNLIIISLLSLLTRYRSRNSINTLCSFSHFR